VDLNRDHWFHFFAAALSFFLVSSFFHSSLLIKAFSYSFYTDLSLAYPSAPTKAFPPHNMAVDFGCTTTVPLNWATNSPAFS